MNIDEELNSPPYKAELARLNTIVFSFIIIIKIGIFQCLRNIKYVDNNFFLRIMDNHVQSIIAIQSLAKDGYLNLCLRECRYLIELSVKACFIVQQDSKINFDVQINQYANLLRKADISILNKIVFYFFNPQTTMDFKEKLKRLYGDCCNYVHTHPKQLLEMLERYSKGRYIGFEGIAELNLLNDNLSSILSAILVLFFHSIPEWAVGELLVNTDGSTFSNFFTKSKFISEIDGYFDYKHERQLNLNNIREARYRNIEF